MRATWKPHTKHGQLTRRSDLPDSVFAFPKERKDPLTDERHVRNALARFDQTRGVSDEERELAFANIKKAAKHYGVDISEADWHELGRRPRTSRPASARKASAKKAAATRKRRGTGTTSTAARKRRATGATARKKAAGTSKKAAGTRKKAAGTRKKGAAARKKTAARKRA
jgi:hypothetical protein